MPSHLSDLTLSNVLPLLYGGVGAAVIAGCVLGVIGLLVSSAAGGGE